MTINSINTDPHLLDYLQSSTDRLRISGINDSSLNSKFQNHIKYTPQEEINKTVSEKFDENSNKINYEFILQSNVPLTKLFKIHRTYNERDRVESRFIDKRETKKAVEAAAKEIVREKNTILGNGYFISINPGNVVSSDLKENPSLALWNNRINKTYQTTSLKKPGTLVNMVF